MRWPKPWPIVAFDMTNVDLHESVVTIAPDFVSFLDVVGVPPRDQPGAASHASTDIGGAGEPVSGEAVTRIDDDALYAILDDDNEYWVLWGAPPGVRAFGTLRIVLQLAHRQAV